MFYSFDELGHLVGTVGPSGHQTLYTRDAAGNVTSVTQSPPRFFAYDAQNRLISETDEEGGVTQYDYDLAGRLVSLTDPVGNTTTFAYDGADRLVSRTDPLGNATTYEYDAAGQTTATVDRNGRRTEFDYDLAGRVLAERWIDPGGAVIRTITFAYDAAGQLTSASDPDSSYAYAYDLDGNLIGGSKEVGSLFRDPMAIGR